MANFLNPEVMKANNQLELIQGIEGDKRRNEELFGKKVYDIDSSKSIEDNINEIINKPIKSKKRPVAPPSSYNERKYSVTGILPISEVETPVLIFMLLEIGDVLFTIMYVGIYGIGPGIHSTDSTVIKKNYTKLTLTPEFENELEQQVKTYMTEKSIVKESFNDTIWQELVITYASPYVPLQQDCVEEIAKAEVKLLFENETFNRRFNHIASVLMPESKERYDDFDSLSNLENTIPGIEMYTILFALNEKIKEQQEFFKQMHPIIKDNLELLYNKTIRKGDEQEGHEEQEHEQEGGGFGAKTLLAALAAVSIAASTTDTAASNNGVARFTNYRLPEILGNPDYVASINTLDNSVKNLVDTTRPDMPNLKKQPYTTHTVRSFFDVNVILPSDVSPPSNVPGLKTGTMRGSSVLKLKDVIVDTATKLGINLKNKEGKDETTDHLYNEVLKRITRGLHATTTKGYLTDTTVLTAIDTQLTSEQYDILIHSIETGYTEAERIIKEDIDATGSVDAILYNNEIFNDIQKMIDKYDYTELKKLETAGNKYMKLDSDIKTRVLEKLRSYNAIRNKHRIFSEVVRPFINKINSGYYATLLDNPNQQEINKDIYNAAESIGESIAHITKQQEETSATGNMKDLEIQAREARLARINAAIIDVKYKEEENIVNKRRYKAQTQAIIDSCTWFFPIIPGFLYPFVMMLLQSSTIVGGGGSLTALIACLSYYVIISMPGSTQAVGKISADLLVKFVVGLVSKIPSTVTRSFSFAGNVTSSVVRVGAKKIGLGDVVNEFDTANSISNTAVRDLIDETIKNYEEKIKSIEQQIAELEKANTELEKNNKNKSIIKENKSTIEKNKSTIEENKTTIKNHNSNIEVYQELIKSSQKRKENIVITNEKTKDTVKAVISNNTEESKPKSWFHNLPFGLFGTKAATKESATKESATKESATKESATKESATKEAATKEAATKEAATKEAATKDRTWMEFLTGKGGKRTKRRTKYYKHKSHKYKTTSMTRKKNKRMIRRNKISKKR